MLGLVGILGNIGLLLGANVAAKYGLKVALIAAVVGVFTVIWTAMMMLIGTAVSLLPSSPLTAFALQFLPHSGTLSAGVGLILTTLVTLKSLEWWRMSWGVTAKIASS